MKIKHLITLAFICLAAAAYGQDTTYYDANNQIVKSLDQALYYRVIQAEQYSAIKSIAREYFKSGKIMSECQLIDISKDKPNWKKTGKYTEWYESGKLHKEIAFLEGVYSGKLVTFWENGKPKRKETYENGRFVDGKCFNAKGDKIEFFKYKQGATFPGGRDSLNAFVRRVKQEQKSESGRELQGVVNTRFLIGTDGSILNVRLDKAVDPLLDKEALRVVSAFPKWIPALQDGVPCGEWIRQPIAFGKSLANEDGAFTDVEKMPQFYGGVKELMNFINSTTRYPKEALQAKISGMVVVRFVVGKSGEIENVSILRSLGYGCDEEAIRVIKSMPRWEPGTQDGVAVPVWFTFPFRFTLR